MLFFWWAQDVTGYNKLTHTVLCMRYLIYYYMHVNLWTHTYYSYTKLETTYLC